MVASKARYGGLVLHSLTMPRTSQQTLSVAAKIRQKLRSQKNAEAEVLDEQKQSLARLSPGPLLLYQLPSDILANILSKLSAQSVGKVARCVDIASTSGLLAIAKIVHETPTSSLALGLHGKSGTWKKNIFFLFSTLVCLEDLVYTRSLCSNLSYALRAGKHVPNTDGGLISAHKFLCIYSMYKMPLSTCMKKNIASF
jgi:hypothetical protein